jgi:hypothetical protein
MPNHYKKEQSANSFVIKLWTELDADLHIYCVAIRIAKEDYDESVSVPLLLQKPRPGIQGDDTRKCPQRLNYCNKTAFIEFLA